MSRILIFTGYGALLAWLSLIPGEAISVSASDKLLHFLAYAVFALLALVVSRKSSTYLWLCLSIVVYGGLIEVLQSFMPTREMSVLDLAANTAGVVVVYCAMRLTAVLIKGANEQARSSHPE